MSARIDVPATKQPAQPRPSRKKNGVISGEAPVSAVPNAPTAQAARPSEARAAAADAIGQHADGIGQREHADEVRGHQQLHLPVGPAVVAELDRGDRHDADHRGLCERGRRDRGARRAEPQQLRARSAAGAARGSAAGCDTSAGDRRRRRAGSGCMLAISHTATTPEHAAPSGTALRSARCRAPTRRRSQRSRSAGRPRRRSRPRS